MIIFVAVVALAGLAGCDPFTSAGDMEIEESLAQDQTVRVFLRDDVTVSQRAAIEARLRVIPGVTEVVFEDRMAAYEKFKKIWENDPSMRNSVTPEDLPESFILTMVDQKARGQVRNSSLNGELLALPGVQDIVVACTTIQECKDLRGRDRSRPR